VTLVFEGGQVFFLRCDLPGVIHAC
jgi:hypothetical protein